MVTNGPHPRTKYPGGLPGGVPGGGLRGGSPGGWSPRVLRGPSRGAILGPVSHPLASNACICEALFLNSTHRCVCQTFRYFSFWPVIRSSYEHRVPAVADMLFTPTVQSTAWPRPPSHIYIVLHHLRPLICLHKIQQKDICIASTSYRSNVCFRRYSGPLWLFPESVPGCWHAYACSFFI